MLVIMVGDWEEELYLEQGGVSCQACYIWFDRCSQQEGKSGASHSILPSSSFKCSSLTAKAPILASIFFF